MVQVYTSSVINSSAEQIWEIIRDFNALSDWHPGIIESRIEAGDVADQIGCIRAISLKDGGSIRERLLALSDYDYTCTYSILESPMGVDNYIATLKLTPITDGNRTFAEWSAKFDCALEKEIELIEVIGQSIFQGGFDSLKIRFGG